MWRPVGDAAAAAVEAVLLPAASATDGGGGGRYLAPPSLSARAGVRGGLFGPSPLPIRALPHPPLALLLLFVVVVAVVGRPGSWLRLVLQMLRLRLLRLRLRLRLLAALIPCSKRGEEGRKTKRGPLQWEMEQPDSKLDTPNGGIELSLSGGRSGGPFLVGQQVKHVFQCQVDK